MHYENIPDSRLTVIHNGINPRLTSNVSLDVASAGARASAGQLIVGTIGRLEPQKGLDLLLAAIPRVVEACPNARFLIVGGGSLEAELRAQAAALGIADRVVFTGWRTDAIDLMQLLDCFVSTSNFEGLPMVMLEAMAFGEADRRHRRRRCAGDSSRTGSTASASATASPSWSRRALLARHRRTMCSRHRLGQNSRARYEERFTAQAMASAYQRIYEQYLQAKKVQAA